MKKILLVNPFGIGDVLFTMTLAEALRHANAEAWIGFVCNERACDLVRMNRTIDHTFVFHRDHFRNLWHRKKKQFFYEFMGFWRMVRDENCDTLFDLSLGREFAFFAMMAGIRRRIGFDYKARGIFLTAKKKILGYEGAPVAEIQLSLLDLAGVEPPRGPFRPHLSISDPIQAEMRRLFRKQGAGDETDVMALAPGGGRSWGENAIYKQWNPERFVEAAKAWISHGRRKVAVFGDAGEAALVRQVAAAISPDALIFLDLPMEKLCAALGRSKLLLCNDSGLLHLANALGVKTVSIFGPVDEKVYGPYWKETPHQVVTEQVPCRPCYQRFHFPPCPYERRCLQDLSIEKVLSAVKKIS